MSHPAFDLSTIDLHYGFVKALDAVDFHVEQGEVVALLGDNAAGKSTLTRTLSGVVRPWQGTIRFAGVPISLNCSRGLSVMLLVMNPPRLAVPSGRP